MKATDLRLMNIIDMAFGETIEFQWSYVKIDDLIRITEYPYSYRPILLTENWLMAFGFIGNELSAQSNVFVFHNKGIYIRGMSGAVHASNIKYVHQLQNLYFAITGEELTLNT